MAEQSYSFLSKQSMGGIHGGEGYTFQDRYLVCHIPEWIADESFVRFATEVTGDIDVIYQEKSKYVYDHIQVKDHSIAPAEFRDVISTFIEINNGTANIYRKFILVAPAVSTQLFSFTGILERYKRMAAFFKPGDQTILDQTFKELKQAAAELKLENDLQFLLDRVVVDIGRIDFSDNSTCKKMFASNVLGNEKFKMHVQEAVFPAYASLLTEILSRKGQHFDKDALYQIIVDSIIEASQKKSGVCLHIHNWTKEKFEPDADYVVDWSERFDRLNRIVPIETDWRELLHELVTTRKKIQEATSVREILFRGKCCLSTGIALGIVFPETGNWSFEVDAPQQGAWRSDANRIENYSLNFTEHSPEHFGIEKGDESELAVLFNITGDALNEVGKYLRNASTPVSRIIVIEPTNKPGNFSIANDSEAVSIAHAAKEVIRKAIVQHGSVKTHLFFFGPFALSLFLGQKLSSVGQIQLYEFQQPGYTPSCLLKT